MLRVLGSLHELGLAHQALQPRNVMFSPEGHLVVLDSYSLTGLSNYKLSYLRKAPQYLSPAQCASLSGMVLDSQDDKLKSDVYAFGLILL
jgi:serine/threonine protein kinase